MVSKVIAAMLVCVALSGVAGCQGVAPDGVRATADVAVPLASPQSGGDQAGLGGLVVKPAAEVSQPNEQRADAGRTTVTGEGNRTIVAPVNVSGSAWAIVAVVFGAAVILGLLAWERRRHGRTKAAAGAVCRAIRDLPDGMRRDRLLGMIERRSEAAGVRDDLDRLAARANARVRRPRRTAVQARG
ncbi:MAG: hypothetical protein BIFFINMI_00628 [Phycisphaerae bacterium]|nr:hypothetical protein [Phycisphaerae bacterium]